MARIRTIKPEFPQSESMGGVSRDARLLFIQLWTLCDDSGRTRAASRMLASLLFPYDDGEEGHVLTTAADVEVWLGELEREGCIALYEVDGTRYLQVCKWLNHQKIDKPSASRFPEFSEDSRTVAKPREGSSGDLDLGPRTKDLGKDQKQKTAPKGDLLADVSPQVAADFRALRTKLRAPITETAINGIRREAAAAGIGLEAALSMCCERGWRGFKAEWAQQQQGVKPLAIPSGPQSRAQGNVL